MVFLSQFVFSYFCGFLAFPIYSFKKHEFFENNLNENNLNENVGSPKNSWKTIQSLGLPKKAPIVPNICLNQNGKSIFNPQSTAEIFKDFFSNIANNLSSQLPVPIDKFGDNFVSSHYKELNIQSFFNVIPTSE